jgi:hypothetical protein
MGLPALTTRLHDEFRPGAPRHMGSGPPHLEAGLPQTRAGMVATGDEPGCPAPCPDIVAAYAGGSAPLRDGSGHADHHLGVGPLVRASVQKLTELVEEAALARGDPAPGVVNREPGSPVNLRKRSHLTRVRWPLGRERVAPDLGGIAAPFNRPGLDDLAATLLDRGEPGTPRNRPLGRGRREVPRYACRASSPLKPQSSAGGAGVERAPTWRRGRPGSYP